MIPLTLGIKTLIVNKHKLKKSYEKPVWCENGIFKYYYTNSV